MMLDSAQNDGTLAKRTMTARVQHPGVDQWIARCGGTIFQDLFFARGIDLGWGEADVVADRGSRVLPLAWNSLRKGDRIHG